MKAEKIHTFGKTSLCNNLWTKWFKNIYTVFHYSLGVVFILSSRSGASA